MNNNSIGDYPILNSVEWEKAPFNSKDTKKVNVTVSITMSKSFTVEVDNYKVVDSGKDEDGNHYEEIEVNEATLKEAVEEQINLPQEAGMLFKRHSHYPPYSQDKIYEDLRGWCVDDFEVIQD